MDGKLNLLLKPGTHPRFFPIYKFIETENQALKEFVKKNLRLKRIKPSTLSGYLILFTPKKNGKLQLCIDY